MIRKWKFVLPSIGMLLSLIFCFNACGPKSAKDIVSNSLKIDVSAAEEISATDTHGGLHGDGTSYIVLKFSDDSLLGQIQGNERWSALPLNRTAKALAYGISEDGNHIGPYLGNIELPEITKGYYCLIDRQGEKETDLLERASLNFTLGIYDTDTDTLYFCEVDT